MQGRSCRFVYIEQSGRITGRSARRGMIWVTGVMQWTLYGSVQGRIYGDASLEQFTRVSWEVRMVVYWKCIEGMYGGVLEGT